MPNAVHLVEVEDALCAQAAMADEKGEGLFRILSLDGGGAKGFYTLGVLHEIEGMLGGEPLYQHFDLIFGTSTGSIIGALIGLGKSVHEILEIYKKDVRTVMRLKRRHEKSAALAKLSKEVFGDLKFDAVKTAVGIVTTKWVIERPMIFKGSITQAHGRIGTFTPGFGCTIGEAVEASCSAYPFFERKTLQTNTGAEFELVDGGYCANNPTLYAIADATVALKIPPERIRVVSIGVGEYPEPKRKPWEKARWYKYLLSVQLLQKTLEINTQSMDQLREVAFQRHRNRSHQ